MRLGAWLVPGIVVKVMSKDLEQHGYYKKKVRGVAGRGALNHPACMAILCAAMQGVVEKVIDRYVGEISMLDSGDVLRVDQAQLETVIPQVR
jgi:DNA/RNA-binding protein KIN17